jgi:hypothetical protein
LVIFLLKSFQEGKYVVMGTQVGNIDILKWGTWDAFEAMVPGHPASVDCMVPLSEDTVITGCSDGFIRYSLSYQRR